MHGRIQQVTVVGTGLLGGSLGLALRAHGFEGRIVGVGRRDATLEAARACGCIDEGTTDLATGVAEADLVVLAPPVGTILKLLPQLAQCLPAGAVVTDVGSTKESIVAAAEAALRRPGRFVGSHPMAGGELTGPRAGDANLFTGKPVILTPTDRTEGEALAQVTAMWEGLGMRLHRMSPRQHDVAVGRISHMPHAAAVLLVALAQEADLEVASTGFGGMTRVAAGDPNMWADIFLDNADALAGVLGEWRKLWAEFEKVLADRDREGVIKLLRDAQQTRREWEKNANELG